MSRSIIMKDSTLREGLDTPGVSFSVEDKLGISRALADAGINEAEIVAPSRVAQDLEFAALLSNEDVGIRTSGLVYANRPQWAEELDRCERTLDRVDLIMPLSPLREPGDPSAKLRALELVLEGCRGCSAEVGVGFPHATQVDPGFLDDIAELAVGLGARRVTIYDTNGSAHPFQVQSLIRGLTARLDAQLHFHGHNDLGMATANSFAAALAGASGLDVTVNGLGDRAGNASLEQVAVALHLNGIETGVDLAKLKDASNLVETASGVPVSGLAPIVGDFAFDHKSPAHLPTPREFEAFDPDLIGGARRSR